MEIIGICASPKEKFSPKGRVETSRSEEQETVLEIFSWHFNSHPLIPDHSGTYRSAEQIHRDSAKEMYFWCRSRGYVHLWAYLWINWYRSSEWILWARSANKTEIPVLKTTMIVESHWRKVKHDYLHRFNRPRIDVVTWVLLSRVIPSALTRMHSLLQKDHRMATASWRKDFKLEWKKVMSRVNNSEISTLYYHTDPIRWVCACPSFLQSRFLFCKHILTCYEPIRNPVDFFRNVQRMRCSPFWVHPQLVLRAEHRRQANILDDAQVLQSESHNLDNGWLEEAEETEEDIDPAAISEDLLVDLDEDCEENLSRFESDLQRALDIFRDQRAKGNSKFLDSFMSTCVKTQNLVQEITARENQQTMPRTWGAWKYMATMYYQ
jgi:hypothetical protein